LLELPGPRESRPYLSAATVCRLSLDHGAVQLDPLYSLYLKPINASAGSSCMRTLRIGLASGLHGEESRSVRLVP